ncbi:hypothetical protein J4440_03580 [Candidatus Woesearchaeota archaeon]|nr:hypothetical protein [Candidatus Woesearchaeota archaeon]
MDIEKILDLVDIGDRNAALHEIEPLFDELNYRFINQPLCNFIGLIVYRPNQEQRDKYYN